jgi:hypothetical protein
MNYVACVHMLVERKRGASCRLSVAQHTFLITASKPVCVSLGAHCVSVSEALTLACWQPCCAHCLLACLSKPIMACTSTWINLCGQVCAMAKDSSSHVWNRKRLSSVRVFHIAVAVFVRAPLLSCKLPWAMTPGQLQLPGSSARMGRMTGLAGQSRLLQQQQLGTAFVPLPAAAAAAAAPDSTSNHPQDLQKELHWRSKCCRRFATLPGNEFVAHSHCRTPWLQSGHQRRLLPQLSPLRFGPWQLSGLASESAQQQQTQLR